MASRLEITGVLSPWAPGFSTELRMLHAGVPLVVVSRRLDHHRTSTTLDRYAHAVPGSDAQAAQTLWQIMQATG
jgi:hypothetical protein